MYKPINEPQSHKKVGVNRHFQASWASQPVGCLLGLSLPAQRNWLGFQQHLLVFKKLLIQVEAKKKEKQNLQNTKQILCTNT